jgi:hypothetical protein
MKICSCIALFLFLASAVNAQTDYIKDSMFIANTSPLNINYSPKELILKISVSTINFANGKQGIELSLMTKETEKKPEIRIDSIVLSTNDFKTLTLNHPYKTSIINTYDGGYLMTAIHWLSKPDIDFLKGETINRIVLTIDQKPLVIEVEKKSQREIKKMADTNF